MKKNQYLIPANTKRGELHFGFLRTVDAVILVTGVGITLLLFVIMTGFNSMDNSSAILGIIPALISVALVVPFPNYHNVMTAIGEVINFYTNRQKYEWRGWCSIYEFKDK